MKKCLSISLYTLIVTFFGYLDVAHGKMQVHLKLDDDLLDSAGGDNNGKLVDGLRGKSQYVPGRLGGARQARR